MNATLGKIVSYACYAAIAVDVAYVIFVYALPFVWKTLVEQCHCLRRTGGICFVICAVFVCGAILYGGTKKGPATPRPPLQQIVPPPSEPAPLQVVENWKKRGAWEDGVLVRFPDGWCFPFASNHLTHVELWSQGAVYPSSSSIDPIASLGALVSLVPGESEVRHGMSPENAYVFEWQSAHVGRSEDDIMDGAIALHRNGDVVVTTNGIVSHIAYEVPFAHDGWGQDDEWVAANFEDGLTAEWYRGWVDGNVGTDLPNGFYKLSARFTEAPREATRLVVAGYSVAVTNAGEYVFLLEKGEEYEFGTWPCCDSVEYLAEDDLAAASEMAGQTSNAPWLLGEWTVDGGWKRVVPQVGDTLGRILWMPVFRGRDDVAHVWPEELPMQFEASLSDYPHMEDVEYEWTTDADWVAIESQNSVTTLVSVAEVPRWRRLALEVKASFHGHALRSLLHLTCGTNDQPQATAALSLPRGIPKSGTRRRLTIDFVSDTRTNGCVTLRCIGGGEHVSMWDSFEEGAQMPLTNTWEVTRSRTIECYLQGESTSGYEEVVFECEYAPENGGPVSEARQTTVFMCLVEPITTEADGNGRIVNPSFIMLNTNGLFRVKNTPPLLKTDTEWSISGGAATFAERKDDENVCYGERATIIPLLEGDIIINVRVLDFHDARMQFKINAIPEEME